MLKQKPQNHQENKRFYLIPLFLIFIFILLSSNAFAAPPFLCNEAQTEGLLKIEYIPFNKVPANDDLTFHIHVYNSSGHLQTDTTTSCYVHFYNNSGSHVHEEVMLLDSNGVDFFVSDFAFTLIPGTYAYIAWCNNTDEGGFISNSFEVLEDINEPVRSDLIPLTIVFGSFLFGLIFVYCGINLRTEAIAKTRVAEKIILYFVGLCVSLSGYFFILLEIYNNTNFTYYKTTITLIFSLLVLSFLAIVGFFVYHMLENTINGENEDDEDY